MEDGQAEAPLPLLDVYTLGVAGYLHNRENEKPKHNRDNGHVGAEGWRGPCVPGGAGYVNKREREKPKHWDGRRERRKRGWGAGREKQRDRGAEKQMS